MVFEPVLEPIILGLKPDQDTRRPPVAGDQNLLAGSQPEGTREVILDLCESDPARLG